MDVKIVDARISAKNPYTKIELAFLSSLAGNSGDDMCEFYWGYHCTCRAGHAHGHVAHGPCNEVLATYPIEPPAG